MTRGRAVGEAEHRLPPVDGDGVAASHVVLEPVGLEIGVEADLVPGGAPAVHGPGRERAPARQVEGHPCAGVLGSGEQRRVRSEIGRVAVAGRHEQGTAGAGEVPQPRQRQAVGQQRFDDADEQPHLHVGVRHAGPLEVGGLEEDVVGAVDGLRVAILIDVGGIALPYVGDAAAEIERPGGGAGADGHRGKGRRRRAGGVECRGGRRRAERVVSRRALDRQGHPVQTGAGTALVHQQVAVRGRAADGGDTEGGVQLRVGPHRDETAALSDKRVEHRRLGRGERRVGEHRKAVVTQRRRGQTRQRHHVEGVQPFGPQDLREIAAKRRLRCVVDDDHDRRCAALPADRARGHERHDTRRHGRHCPLLHTMHLIPRRRTGPVPRDRPSATPAVEQSECPPDWADRQTRKSLTPRVLIDF